jgi:hypothetical protein
MEPEERMSRRAMAGVVIIACLAVIWFLVSWRVFNSPLIDAAGETAGALALLLVVVSLAGAIRR